MPAPGSLSEYLGGSPMEAALQNVLTNMFGGYVTGIEQLGSASFPLKLRDLKLRESVINKEIAAGGFFPFDLGEGKIGSISVTPSFMGGVEIAVTDVVLNLSFSPMRAMRGAMRAAEISAQRRKAAGVRPPRPGGGAASGGNFASYPPPQANADRPIHSFPAKPSPARSSSPSPPRCRHCPEHDRAENQNHGPPKTHTCDMCKASFRSTATHVLLCTECSDLSSRCAICGAAAAVPSSWSEDLPSPLGPAVTGAPSLSEPLGGGWGGGLTSLHDLMSNLWAGDSPRRPQRRASTPNPPRKSWSGDRSGGSASARSRRRMSDELEGGYLLGLGPEVGHHQLYEGCEDDSQDTFGFFKTFDFSPLTACQEDPRGTTIRHEIEGVEIGL